MILFYYETLEFMTINTSSEILVDNEKSSNKVSLY